MDIDTHLGVFGIILQVSTAVLKMHSQYFFKFLDSADKVGGTGHGDDWHVVAAGLNAHCSI